MNSRRPKCVKLKCHRLLSHFAVLQVLLEGRLESQCQPHSKNSFQEDLLIWQNTCTEFQRRLSYLRIARHQKLLKFWWELPYSLSEKPHNSLRPLMETKSPSHHPNLFHRMRWHQLGHQQRGIQTCSTGDQTTHRVWSPWQCKCTECPIPQLCQKKSVHFHSPKECQSTDSNHYGRPDSFPFLHNHSTREAPCQKKFPRSQITLEVRECENHARQCLWPWLFWHYHGQDHHYLERPQSAFHWNPPPGWKNYQFLTLDYTPSQFDTACHWFQRSDDQESMETSRHYCNPRRHWAHDSIPYYGQAHAQVSEMTNNPNWSR